jgi:hypothetical protein
MLYEEKDIKMLLKGPKEMRRGFFIFQNCQAIPVNIQGYSREGY